MDRRPRHLRRRRHRRRRQTRLGERQIPLFTAPAPGYHGLNFWEVRQRRPFGNIAFAIRARVEGLRDIGPSLSPFNAFQLLQGVETLSPARPAPPGQHPGAGPLAQGHQVAWVEYNGLEDSPTMCWRKVPAPTASVRCSTSASGGANAARTFIDNVELASHLANVETMPRLWSSTRLLPPTAAALEAEQRIPACAPI